MIENWGSHPYCEGRAEGPRLRSEPKKGSVGFFAPWLSEGAKFVNGKLA